MMRSLVANRFLSRISLHQQFSRSLHVETESWSVFPREREGNNYDLNFSLLEDGVTSVGDSFRNARIQLLTSRLPKKVEKGNVELANPLYFGNFVLKEAGDDFSLDDFSTLQSHQQEILSNGSEIFVEDAGLGSFSPFLVGAPIFSHNPALSLIFRQLMVRCCIICFISSFILFRN